MKCELFIKNKKKRAPPREAVKMLTDKSKPKPLDSTYRRHFFRLICFENGLLHLTELWPSRWKRGLWRHSGLYRWQLVTKYANYIKCQLKRLFSSVYFCVSIGGLLDWNGGKKSSVCFWWVLTKGIIMSILICQYSDF